MSRKTSSAYLGLNEANTGHQNAQSIGVPIIADQFLKIGGMPYFFNLFLGFFVFYLNLYSFFGGS